MMGYPLQLRRLSYGPRILGLAMLLALCGCKSSSSDSGGRSGGSDPLVSGARIPAQNVPLPDRGGVTGKDPLTNPVAKPVDKTGVGYSDDPQRFKGSYIPGPNSTPAALAGKVRDSDELRIDGNENRVPLQPVSGVMPTRPQETSASIEALYRELENYGCKSGDRSLTQENGRYVFRATVSRGGINAPKLQCTETGVSGEEAIKKVLDDLADQK